MPITASDWVTRLSAVDGKADALITAHLADNSELLLHLLMADTRRLAIDAYKHGDRALLDRLLAVVEAGLVEGDERVENAVAVSFVEDTGWWELEADDFIATWPPALRAELERWRPTISSQLGLQPSARSSSDSGRGAHRCRSSAPT